MWFWKAAGPNRLLSRLKIKNDFYSDVRSQVQSDLPLKKRFVIGYFLKMCTFHHVYAEIFFKRNPLSITFIRKFSKHVHFPQHLYRDFLKIRTLHRV